MTTHESTGYARGCELAFSDDGKWLATVVSSDELVVIISDGKTGAVHKRFSSPWREIGKHPIEWAYRSSFLGGFLADDSLVLWRYVPREVSDPTDASNLDLYMERWSVEGERLAQLDLGKLGSGIGGRQPIFARQAGRLWLPGDCRGNCYRGIQLSGAEITQSGNLMFPDDLADPPIPLADGNGFLAVLGIQKTSQKAASFDSAGRLQKEVRLPHSPNLFGPLIPDWFYASQPQSSSDGEIAAVARTRVAWVLVDTDRDWGSEIVVLKTQPLTVVTVLKTGKGGIGPIAVDHRNGVVRVVGFWNGRWHDKEYDDQHPGKWKH